MDDMGVMVINKNNIKKYITSPKVLIIPATLVNLKELYCSVNQLTELRLPNALVNLTNLYYDGNRLTTLNIPETLVNLTVHH